MEIREEIENMFREIENYSGNFGDPIATVFSFEPIDLLSKSGSDEFLTLGAGAGLLVNFSVYIDNSDYESARGSKFSGEIKMAIRSKKFDQYASLRSALDAALVSESQFNAALGVVYGDYIKGKYRSA